MRGRGRLIVAVLALAGSVGAAPAPRVSQLGWLAGTWIEEKDGGWTEERWAPPRGGVMLGTTLSGRGGQAGEFEFTRIAADSDGTIRYWASVEGAPAVPFRLVAAAPGTAAFENLQHDYPTRIAYRRLGDVLIAEISGPGGVHPMRWRYRRR